MPITQYFYTPEQQAAGEDKLFASVTTVAGVAQGAGAGGLSAIAGLPDSLDEGIYEITLNYLVSFLVPNISTPKQVELAGWIATLESYTNDEVNKQLHLRVSLKKSAPAAVQEGTFLAAVPLSTIVYAITLVFGLAAILFTVVEVRKVFEAPSLNIIMIFGAIAFVVYIVFGGKFLKGGLR
jgi:hypothetical protein